MAGFIDNDNQENTLFHRIRSAIRDISRFNMRYSDLVVKNSQAIGVSEAMFMKKGPIEDEALMYSLGRQDTTIKEYISYFDKEYGGKRDYLRKFALNPEIEFVLDLICDEAISYDPSNYFAHPALLNLIDANEKTLEKVDLNYKELYDLWGFNDDTVAWNYFRQLLVEGFLCFEVIWDNDGKKIIGFKEMDPSTVVPGAVKNPDGTFTPVWIQYPDDVRKKRELFDAQIIYISYAKGNSISRLSYLERMIRPYNILRIIEHSRVIWAVMNSSFRMKMTVPIGTRSPQKAMQTLGELMSIYNEDIRFNDESGELTIDGRPKLQFHKNYMMPSGVNGTPQIEPIKMEGPELNDTQPLSYFYQKFITESKVPSSRFQGPDGGTQGNYVDGADGLDQEEVRFDKFINRLRSIFQEILLKPLWLQMSRDIPALKDDYLFKSQLGLEYFSDNPFKINRQIEIMSNMLESITELGGITVSSGDEEEGGEGEGDPYFSMGYLVEKYMGLSEIQIRKNREMKKKKKEAKEKKGKEGKKGEEKEKEKEEGTE